MYCNFFHFYYYMQNFSLISFPYLEIAVGGGGGGEKACEVLENLKMYWKMYLNVLEFYIEFWVVTWTEIA